MTDILKKIEAYKLDEIAADVVNKRLENIRPRLQRAGVEAELVLIGQNGGGLEDLNGQADLVFVDAPCSGSGTWRRRPEDAWRLTAEEVEKLHGLQVRILSQATKLVKPGGRLVYVTCSLLDAEVVIERGANAWLKLLKTRNLPWRFDVIEILLEEGEKPKINHVKDAF